MQRVTPLFIYPLHHHYQYVNRTDDVSLARASFFVRLHCVTLLTSDEVFVSHKCNSSSEGILSICINLILYLVSLELPPPCSLPVCVCVCVSSAYSTIDSRSDKSAQQPAWISGCLSLHSPPPPPPPLPPFNEGVWCCGLSCHSFFPIPLQSSRALAFFPLILWKKRNVF